MPLALLIIGYVLVVTGLKGNFGALGDQFNKDVIGTGGNSGFIAFAEGIIGIAIFFRVIGMPNAGRVFLILVLLAFILKNQNILTALENISTTASGSTNTTTPAAATTGGVAQTPTTTPATAATPAAGNASP